MRKVALVFVLAVFVPSLVLAWLAVRSLRDQQFVLERQQSLSYQGLAMSLAKDADAYLTGRRHEFNQHVNALIGDGGPGDAVARFDSRLREAWPMAEVGFVVALKQDEAGVLEPPLFAGPEARAFRLNNDRFLSSREAVEVYWNSPKGPINLSKLDAGKEPSPEMKSKSVFATKAGKLSGTNAPGKDAGLEAAPAEETGFRQLIGDATEGTLARFLQDKLKLLFWYRSQRDPQLVFGAQVNLRTVVDDLKNLIAVDPAFNNEVCVALLDDGGRPVAVTQPHFQTNWKRPFVSAEIGEALPHWEVAVYLLNPAQLGRSASAFRLTLGLLIAVLVLAIGVGSWLIVADLKRQLTLARQKTDFVSNVSHELKTPLTSIRMFSELLVEGRVREESKQREYLKVITAETARLTRLINNVLDFARMERGEAMYQLQQCDLATVVRETMEAHGPQLKAHGYHLQCRIPSEPVLVRGDCDALAQVLVNLISNAEKYGGEARQIEVGLESRNGAGAVVRVSDRGGGVPAGCEEKIFEQFYRAHDSLGSGIQGSGLGLTLARQIARAHGGDVAYRPREGGGSCFTLELPTIH